MTKTTLKDRLRLAMKGPPVVSGADLARACGVKPPSVSDWLSGKTKAISDENLDKAARRLGVNPAWLRLGEGPMRGKAPSEGTGTQNASSVPDGLLRPEWIAETAMALRKHAARSGKRFDIESRSGAGDFAYWYAVRAVLPDVSALDNVIDLESRRQK